MERVADDGQARGGRGFEAKRAQRVGAREDGRVGGAAIPFAQQMDSVHQPPPVKKKPHPGRRPVEGIRAIAKSVDL